MQISYKTKLFNNKIIEIIKIKQLYNKGKIMDKKQILVKMKIKALLI